VGVCYPAERSPEVHIEGLGRAEARNRKAVPRSRARGGSIVYANTSWPRGEVSIALLSSAELTQHQREAIQGSNQQVGPLQKYSNRRDGGYLEETR
jgi:hypothetical protein